MAKYDEITLEVGFWDQEGLNSYNEIDISKNKWYYDVGKHKAHPLLLLLLCLAACFLGRPYDYWGGMI